MKKTKMVFKQVNNNTKLLLFWARKSKLEEKKIKKEVLRRTQLLHLTTKKEKGKRETERKRRNFNKFNN